jgi:hypothetical protein
MKIDEKLLDESLKLRKYIRECASKDEKFAFEYDMCLFLKIMHGYITPQSYGSRIQNRLLKEYNLIKVPSSLDKGDAKNNNQKHGEIKISYKDVENRFHFVQIRPYQKCNFYLLYTIDPDDNYSTITFIILEDNINEVLKKFGATNCHGVSKNKLDKTKEELRFSVEKNTDAWKYLIDNFLVLYAKEFIENIN